MTHDEVVKAYERNGRNQTATAKELGLSRSTVQYHLSQAAIRGDVAPELRLTPIGFNVKRLTQHVRKDEHGKVDLSEEWTQFTPESSTYDDTIAAIDEVMKQHAGIIPHIPAPPIYPDTKLATFYPIIDHHLGLYAWEPETGANYDLNIAQKVLRDSLGELVASTPNSDQAVILNIGDFFHSDDNTNRTRRSGNILDADGRYAKILEIGIDLELYAIELALTKHQRVEVRNLPGNHDPYASIALNSAIRMAFRDNPRVHVSRDPSPFYFWRFGKVLVGATHGDMIRHTDMPQVLAAYAAKDWGETEHRYVYLGHVHHKSIGGGEKFGATWETFRTLAPKDAWASQSGFASSRSMVAITHHREYGEKYRNTVTIAGPGFKVR
jgi:hypothetical protein